MVCSLGSNAAIWSPAVTSIDEATAKAANARITMMTWAVRWRVEAPCGFDDCCMGHIWGAYADPEPCLTDP